MVVYDEALEDENLGTLNDSIFSSNTPPNVSIYTYYSLQLKAFIVTLIPESVRIPNITSHNTRQHLSRDKSSPTFEQLHDKNDVQGQGPESCICMSGVHRAANPIRSQVPGLVSWYVVFWDWKENAMTDKTLKGKWDGFVKSCCARSERTRPLTIFDIDWSGRHRAWLRVRAAGPVSGRGARCG